MKSCCPSCRHSSVGLLLWGTEDIWLHPPRLRQFTFKFAGVFRRFYCPLLISQSHFPPIVPPLHTHSSPSPICPVIWTTKYTKYNRSVIQSLPDICSPYKIAGSHSHTSSHPWIHSTHETKSQCSAALGCGLIHMQAHHCVAQAEVLQCDLLQLWLFDSYSSRKPVMKSSYCYWAEGARQREREAWRAWKLSDTQCKK